MANSPESRPQVLVQRSFDHIARGMATLRCVTVLLHIEPAQDDDTQPGCLSLICRVASSPFMPPILKSMSATSGLSTAAFSTASRPSPAFPTR